MFGSWIESRGGESSRLRNEFTGRGELQMRRFADYRNACVDRCHSPRQRAKQRDADDCFGERVSRPPGKCSDHHHSARRWRCGQSSNPVRSDCDSPEETGRSAGIFSGRGGAATELASLCFTSAGGQCSKGGLQRKPARAPRVPVKRERTVHRRVAIPAPTCVRKGDHACPFRRNPKPACGKRQAT